MVPGKKSRSTPKADLPNNWIYKLNQTKAERNVVESKVVLTQ
jgi:hypothetical protein